MRKMFNKYINGDISFSEMKQLTKINWVEPSNNNTYFYNPPQLISK